MNVNYALRRARQHHGDRTATDHDGQVVTYREFAAQVEASARRLAGLDVRAGDRVAVLMGNSPAYLDLYFSLPLLGALIVPLNTRWHSTEVVFTLNDSGAAWLIVDDRFAAMAAQVRHEAPVLKGILYYAAGACPEVIFTLNDSGAAWLTVDDRFAAMAAQVRHEAPALKGILYYAGGACPEGMIDFRTLPAHPDAAFGEPDEDDLVGLFYTSGTTGGPKGAMLSHRNLYSNAVHAMLPPSFVEPDSRYLHVAPMFHLADVAMILALTLSGSSHSFLPSFDPEVVLAAIQRYRITSMVLVPTMINLIVHHPSFGKFDLSSLRRVSYGASPMPLSLLKTAMEKLKCKFSQGYGMTETSPLLTVLLPEEHRMEEGYEAVQSAGRAVMGVEVRVVDGMDRDVPVGEVGEIIARGPNVMRGYWNRPEISADALRGGWMHTGDLGRFDQQGYLYVMDRKKDMIKPGGENVYSPEVESVLCAHPAVLEAAVIGIPDAKWGEAIRAVVALRPGESLSEADLIAWCRARATHFKCPSSVVFTDMLPKGGTGKVQKNVLRERFGGNAGTKSTGGGSATH